MGSRKRFGFTLVELLVVIVIIAILMALLLPAIQLAREAGRRSTCSNNLKNLAIGLLNYEGANKTIPPAITFRGWGPTVTNMSTGQNEDYDKNWVIYILPFIEGKSVYDLFDFKQQINVPQANLVSGGKAHQNVQARNTELSVMLCPSDVGSDVHFFKTGWTIPAGFEANQVGWARGNYGANGGNNVAEDNFGLIDLHSSANPLNGLTFLAHSLHCGITDKNTGRTQTATQANGWNCRESRGVFGICTEAKLNDVTDGLSKTMLLSEIRIGLNQVDRRGTWAMSSTGASAIFWCGFGGDSNGPNPISGGADDVLDCNAICTTAGSGDANAGGRVLLARGMGCWPCDSPGGQKQATSRSRHPGGVLTVACDAAVHWASNKCANPAGWGFDVYPWDYYILAQDHGDLSGAGGNTKNFTFDMQQLADGWDGR